MGSLPIYRINPSKETEVRSVFYVSQILEVPERVELRCAIPPW
jgi:hypothetical protein